MDIEKHKEYDKIMVITILEASIFIVSVGATTYLILSGFAKIIKAISEKEE